MSAVLRQREAVGEVRLYLPVSRRTRISENSVTAREHPPIRLVVSQEFRRSVV